MTVPTLAQLLDKEFEIVDASTIPSSFQESEMSSMTGADGGFTREQRHIVKTYYTTRFIELEATNPTKGAESAWKSKALGEILKLRAFHGIYEQPTPKPRTPAGWDDVSHLYTDITSHLRRV